MYVRMYVYLSAHTRVPVLLLCSVSDITVVDDYAEMKDLAEEDDQDVEDIVPDEEEDLGSMLQRTDLRDFALGSSAYAVAESTGDMVQLLQPQR